MRRLHMVIAGVCAALTLACNHQLEIERFLSGADAPRDGGSRHPEPPDQDTEPPLDAGPDGGGAGHGASGVAAAAGTTPPAGKGGSTGGASGISRAGLGGRSAAGGNAGGGSGGSTGTRVEPASAGSSDAVCSTASPCQFLEGFETLEQQFTPSGQRWRSVKPELYSIAVTDRWSHSCSRSLQVQGQDEFAYALLPFRGASEVTLEFWFAVERAQYGSGEFGFAQVAGATTAKVFSIQINQGTLTFVTPGHEPVKIREGLPTFESLSETARYNYFQAQLNFSAGKVRFKIGSDSNAGMEFELGGSAAYNALYFIGGPASASFDDIAIWTPGATLNRRELCDAEVLDKITRPGGGPCTGLAWDGTSLWLINDSGDLYVLEGTKEFRLERKLGIEANGLSWDGTGFWTRNLAASSLDAEFVRIQQSGVIDRGPPLFDDEANRPRGAQCQWSSEAFWCMSSLPTILSKWSFAGEKLDYWDVRTTEYLSLSGMLVVGDNLYVGAELWRQAGPDDETGVLKLSLKGAPIGFHNLTQLGVPAANGTASLASDGMSYWYCGSRDENVYHLHLPL